MSLRFPKASGSRPSFRPGTTSGSGLTPLQKITQQYRDRQATTAAATQQQISELSKQRSRITTAVNAPQTAQDKPLQTYLDRSGQMVEKRISALQAKINGLHKP